MVGMVDAAAFNQQNKAVRILRQACDGRLGKINQGRLSGRILGAVHLELHVRAFEQTEDFHIRGEICGGETGLIGDVDMVWALGDPFGGQVAAILAAAHLAFVFRVSFGLGQEGRASAAHSDFEPIAFGPFDQLAGNVLAVTCIAASEVCVGFPVAVRGFRIGGAGCRMRDASCGDDTGGQAFAFGEVENGICAVAYRAGAITARGFLQHAQCAGIDLDARGHGRGSGGGICDLIIVAVGFGQRHVGQGFHGQAVGFTVEPTFLASIDARGRDGGNAHAIAHKQDDILGGLHAACSDSILNGGCGGLEIGVFGLNGRRASAVQCWGRLRRLCDRHRFRWGDATSYGQGGQ